ncbi:hypothetical protein A8709_14360 [Paenibacillus pectinilyticus]|uniref:Uncharacterized protein n=1 Tax=Paenibacillus pectinilyticus TaxID=512399 RepID=A0A1C1A404_9BACL|nr:hypothetical protein A8709_14360 [Paenibacillus pectinilyticus]
MRALEIDLEARFFAKGMKKIDIFIADFKYTELHSLNHIIKETMERGDITTAAMYFLSLQKLCNKRIPSVLETIA